jgi:hypothetical protein
MTAPIERARLILQTRHMGNFKNSNISPGAIGLFRSKERV